MPTPTHCKYSLWKKVLMLNVSRTHICLKFDEQNSIWNFIFNRRTMATIQNNSIYKVYPINNLCTSAHPTSNICSTVQPVVKLWGRETESHKNFMKEHWVPPLFLLFHTYVLHWYLSSLVLLISIETGLLVAKYN